LLINQGCEFNAFACFYASSYDKMDSAKICFDLFIIQIPNPYAYFCLFHRLGNINACFNDFFV